MRSIFYSSCQKYGFNSVQARRVCSTSGYVSNHVFWPNRVLPFWSSVNAVHGAAKSTSMMVENGTACKPVLMVLIEWPDKPWIGGAHTSADSSNLVRHSIVGVSCSSRSLNSVLAYDLSGLSFFRIAQILHNMQRSYVENARSGFVMNVI